MGPGASNSPAVVLLRGTYNRVQNGWVSFFYHVWVQNRTYSGKEWRLERLKLVSEGSVYVKQMPVRFAEHSSSAVVGGIRY